MQRMENSFSGPGTDLLVQVLPLVLGPVGPGILAAEGRGASTRPTVWKSVFSKSSLREGAAFLSPCAHSTEFLLPSETDPDPVVQAGQFLGVRETHRFEVSVMEPPWGPAV